MTICKICKGEFTGRANKIYCTPRCKRRAKKNHRRERLRELFLKNNPGFSDFKEFSTEEGIHSNHRRKGQDRREIEEGQECYFFGLNRYSFI